MRKIWLGAVLGGLFVLAIGYQVIRRGERAIDRARRVLAE